MVEHPVAPVGEVEHLVGAAEAEPVGGDDPEVPGEGLEVEFPGQLRAAAGSG